MLRVRLLGGLALECDGRALPPPRAAAARALLAWLALHPGPQPRGELAPRFWPDVLDESARQSLRNALWALRRDLGPAAGALRSERDTLALDGDVEVDARALDAALERGDAATAAALAEAGELLRGFDDEWALAARDERRERVSSVLAELAGAAADPLQAVAWARRRARLDPLSEEAARDLMVRLEAAGDGAAAVAVYERLAARLRRELRVAPSAATRAAAERLRTVSGDPAIADAGVATAAAPDRGAVEPAAPERPTSARAAPALLPRMLPLAGRAAELAALLGEWAGARGGAGGVVVLEGEAGIGKTRLAAELAARVAEDGGRGALGAAVDLQGAAPLAPWAELLDGLVGTPDPARRWTADLAPLLPRLGRPGGARDAAGEFGRIRLHEAAVAAVAETAVAEAPLLLVLEDAHLADDASLALLAHMGRRLRALPALLLVTRRPAPPNDALDAVEHHLDAAGALRARLVLAPLRPGDAATLVRAAATLDDAGARRAVEAADGNALLAVETARALAAGHTGPPPSLRTAVRGLLHGLSLQARDVAELLAVAGRPLDPAELDALPVGDPAPAASEGLACGLLEGDGAVGYRHALLREVAYATLEPPRRRLLHGHVADALLRAAQAPPAEVGRHLRHAGRDDEAVEHLARAARQARDVVALAAARAFALEAIELRPEDPGLWLLLAHVEALRGRHEDMRAASEEGLARIAPHDRRARGLALVERGTWLSSALCWPAEAIADFRAASTLLAGEDDLDPERRRLLAASAWAEAVAGDPALVDDLLARAAELRPAGQDDLLDVHAVSARVNALIRQDRAPDALALADRLEAATRGRRSSHRLGETVWLEFASVAAFVGELERALAFAERYLEVSGGLLPKRIEGLAARAYVLVRLGKAEAAVAAAEEMVALADELGDDELPSLPRHDLGMVLCETGEHGRGVEVLARALADGGKVRTSHSRLRRAESLVVLGRLDEAAGELRATVLEPLTPADQPETLVPRVARLQALLAAARGDPERADGLFAEAAAGWRRLGALDQREAYMSNLVDLGRPPVAGLTEPARELARVEAEREELLHAQLR